MSLVTKDLLINFLLIIVPVLLFNLYGVEQKLFQKNNDLKGKVLLTVALSISIVLAMVFSFTIGDGVILDFRAIPFIVGVLYGGTRIGLILLAVLVTTRFIIGGSGIEVAVLTQVVLFICAAFVSKRFLTMSPAKRIGIAATFIIWGFVALLGCSWIIYGSILFFKDIWVSFLSINMMGIILFTHLIEAMILNYKLQNDVLRSEKSEVIGQLAASIAHEIRNPLTTSSGVVQLLLKDDLTPEKRKALLKLTYDEINKTERVISDYLQVARPSLDVIETIDINDILDSSIEMIRPLANMNGIAVYKYTAQSCVVKGDVQRYSQTFLNLLKNGVEAMPEGGTLSISCLQDKRNVVISIADTGVGMSDVQIRRLGEPYYSTKSNGTGLGMMVVFRLIQNMGGQVLVESKVNFGTKFKIILPIAESSA